MKKQSSSYVSFNLESEPSLFMLSTERMIVENKLWVWYIVVVAINRVRHHVNYAKSAYSSVNYRDVLDAN